MKKKAFTLIELLAVIVILAVIALIATPAVLGIIEDSKKSAAEASARNIANAAKAYYMSNLMNNISTGTIDLSNSSFKYDGDKATKGYLTYDSAGNAVGKMYVSGYCIEIKNDGSITSEKVDENDCDIESPAPSTTDLSCFDIIDATITNYKCYKENEYGLPTITDVVIPNSVIYISDGAFDSKNLTSLIMPNSVISFSDFAFANNKLTSIIIPDSVTTIGHWAFQNNQLTSVTIPNGVTYIGDGAFNINNLISIEIPNSVTSISNNAFSNNSTLKTITIDNTSGSISGSPWGAKNATIKYLR